MFAKVENGVTKIVPLKTQFRAEIFHFFQQDRLLFAKVDIGLTQFPTKTAKKEEEEKGPEIFFQKSACASRYQWGIFILFLLAAEKLYNFWGGYNFKTGWAVTIIHHGSWSIYKQHAPAPRRFLAQK